MVSAWPVTGLYILPATEGSCWMLLARWKGLCVSKVGSFGGMTVGSTLGGGLVTVGTLRSVAGISDGLSGGMTAGGAVMASWKDLAT